jgi:Arc/MetJ-type ribon-helix-helix transcriptional regulator
MPIDVSKEFEEEIARRVAEGPYGSAEEFLRQILDIADEYRRLVRTAIEEGAAAADRGELRDGEEVFDALDADLASAEKSSKGA